MRVFLSFHFEGEDRELAATIQKLLVSHDLQAVTGRRLGGNQLEPAIKEKILECDALITLMTRAEKIQGKDEWRTHRWAEWEYDCARGENKHAIALVEAGVKINGPAANYERIDFDRADPASALLALSETLAEWRRKHGKTLKVRIQPKDLAELAGLGDGVGCRYRIVRGGGLGEWKTIAPVDEGVGTFLTLRGLGIRDDDVIHVELRDGNSKWQAAVPQWLQASLKKKGD